MIEQAIFTSTKSGRNDGYHLVASSPGIADDDAHSLTVWGPAHDSLNHVDEVHAAGAGRRCGSTNSFPLPSGAYCVSRTVAAGAEYSGRRGPRVYTQCLVVPLEVLGRFANNPFRLLEAASAAGHIRVLDKFPHQLRAISLSGRASTVDRNLLDHLCSDPGPRQLAGLLASAMAGDVLGIVGFDHPEQLIGGLMTLIPPAMRTDCSFSTGLKVSPRRPFRWMAIQDTPDERRRLSVAENARLVDLKNGWRDAPDQIHGWSRLVLHLLRNGSIGRLEELFQKSHPDWTTADLDRWSEQWLGQFESPPAATEHAAATDGDEECAVSTSRSDAGETSAPASLRAHAPHPLGHRPRAADDKQSPVSPPSATLDLSCQSLMDQLEVLDSTVLDAVQGDPEALTRLRSLWPEIVRQLGPELIEESRAQYLQFALSAWPESAAADHDRDPARAAVALDVLTLLFDG